jgi:endonuclease/exonuclease/phosphatase family metal-dependent hydrolase
LVATCIIALASGVSAPADELTIIDYNLWHARMRGKRLESREQQLERHRRQIEAIREVDPDLVVLQEVSPAPEMAELLADELGMDAVRIVENCGIQIRLPGKSGVYRRRLGKPKGFVNGMVILAKPELGLNGRKRAKLSGPPSINSSGCCFQFGEVRYAMLAAIDLPGVGVTLVGNVHLHASGMPGAGFMQALEDLRDEEQITAKQYDKLISKIEKGDHRRFEELERFLQALDRLIAKLERSGTPVQAVILSGDFNDRPDSELVTRVLDRGFVDLAGGEREVGPTWDPRSNSIIPDLHNPKRKLPDWGNPHLLELYASPLAERSPKRVDYVFVSPELQRPSTTVRRFQPKAPDGADLSDHYGVVVVIPAE